jgi:hypothetical protein
MELHPEESGHRSYQCIRTNNHKSTHHKSITSREHHCMRTSPLLFLHRSPCNPNNKQFMTCSWRTAYSLNLEPMTQADPTHLLSRATSLKHIRTFANAGLIRASIKCHVSQSTHTENNKKKYTSKIKKKRGNSRVSFLPNLKDYS